MKKMYWSHPDRITAVWLSVASTPTKRRAFLAGLRRNWTIHVAGNVHGSEPDLHIEETSTVMRALRDMSHWPAETLAAWVWEGASNTEAWSRWRLWWMLNGKTKSYHRAMFLAGHHHYPGARVSTDADQAVRSLLIGLGPDATAAWLLSKTLPDETSVWGWLQWAESFRVGVVKKSAVSLEAFWDGQLA